ncbi:MAG: 16S rRNA (uracil(1498)-N(3))-methyltransferase [Treponema sp.]|nr:16S rRNA (uracil(1498)-N(3))-methyltransferase [Treponema sp.]
MKQFILNTEPDRDGIVRLEDKDYKYLIRVRRLAAGECFPALLPNGERTVVQIISADNGILTGKCGFSGETTQKIENEKTIPPIILFQALPKGEKMDLIVRQAAECGISEIIPFESKFSIAKASSNERKLSRWDRIVKEARQQSGSKTATVVKNPLTMSGLFECWEKMRSNTLRGNEVLGLLFHHLEIDRGTPLEHKSLHSYLNSIPTVAALVIGPEGGFSESEVSDFQENGFKVITIGDTVLRTETAALFCAAAVRILLLERNSWELKQPK